VLEAYLDASEEQLGAPVAAMDSWVANQAHWQKFENLWKLFLSMNEIKGRFRTSEFLARQGQFNWSDEKHNRVIPPRGHLSCNRLLFYDVNLWQG
jgi:hypothetical protein